MAPEHSNREQFGLEASMVMQVAVTHPPSGMPGSIPGQSTMHAIIMEIRDREKAATLGIRAQESAVVRSVSAGEIPAPTRKAMPRGAATDFEYWVLSNGMRFDCS